MVAEKRERDQVDPSDRAHAARAALRAFQGEQGLPPLDGSRQAVERVKGQETLRGRDRLRETLAGFGRALR